MCHFAMGITYCYIKHSFYRASSLHSVDRVALWKALRGSGVPPFLLQLIRDLHTGTAARVRTPQGMSDVFYTTSGVRQGCILLRKLHINGAEIKNTLTCGKVHASGAKKFR